MIGAKHKTNPGTKMISISYNFIVSLNTTNGSINMLLWDPTPGETLVEYNVLPSDVGTPGGGVDVFDLLSLGQYIDTGTSRRNIISGEYIYEIPDGETTVMI